MKKNKEKWKVFMYQGKELCAYTVRGESADEEECTKAFLAMDHNIAVNDINVIKTMR